MLELITFPRNRLFELVDIGQRWLEGKSAVGMKWEALSAITPTISEPYFHAMSIVTQQADVMVRV
jgi:hypothetical protein